MIFNPANVSISGTITGGTTGSVLFVGPSSTFAQDNANFFWDDTNNRLGIGTANPGAALEVKTTNGKIYIGAWAGAAADYSGLGLAGSMATGNYNFVSSPSDTNLYVNRPSAKNIYFRENNVDAVTFLTGGNVGIGTASPADVLEVSKNTSGGVGGRILVSNRATSATSNEADIGFITDSLFTAGTYSARIANIETSTSARSDLAFFLYDGGTVMGTEKMRILNNGNVGIGTATPAFDAFAGIHVAVDGGTGAGSFGSFGLGSNQSGTAAITSEFAFFNSNLGTADKRIAAFVGRTDGATNSGAIDFYTWNAGTAAAAMTIEGNGNVGIGTASPTAPLQISNSGISTTLGQLSNNLRFENVESSTVDAGSEISFKGLGATLNTTIYAAISAPLSSAAAEGIYGYLSFSTKTLRTDTALTERMRITNDGLVGINTTAPSQALTVVGGILGGSAAISTGLDGGWAGGMVSTSLDLWQLKTTNAQGTEMGFTTASGKDWRFYAAGASTYGGVPAGSFGIYEVTNYLAPSFVISPTSNVGIGTGLPNAYTASSMLTLYRASSVALNLTTSVGADWRFVANEDANGDFVFASAANGSSTYTTRFKLNTAGNCYIAGGTGAPGARLQVDGAASAITSIFKANATTPGNITEWQNSSGTILAQVDSAGGLYINKNTGNTSISTSGTDTIIKNFNAALIRMQSNSGMSFENSSGTPYFAPSPSIFPVLGLPIIIAGDGTSATGMKLEQPYATSYYYLTLRHANGGGTAGLKIFAANDMANSAYTVVENNASGADFISTKTGTGTTVPIRFFSDSTEQMRITTAGLVGIATTAPDRALEINSATGINLRLTYNDANGSAANYADFSTSSGGDLTIAPSGGDTSITGTLALSGKTVNYNSVATAGWGVPAIYASGRATAQTAANTSISTYTVGAADGSFTVSANVLVTTSSAENFTTIVTYTDEGNTARTLTLNFQLIGGVMGSAINFSNGAVPYEGIPVHIRAKASTAITVKTTGTFTGATYNCEGVISQIS